MPNPKKPAAAKASTAEIEPSDEVRVDDLDEALEVIPFTYAIIQLIR
jgi:hypothetical protein